MRPNPHAQLLAVVEPTVQFTANDGQAFVRVRLDCGGFFSHPVRSPAFRDWFLNQFYGRYEFLPTSHQFHALLNFLEARARHYDESWQRIPVFRRVGSTGPGRIPNKILLDLANPSREFVEISPAGWKTTDGPAALFQSSRSTLSLPAPVSAAAQPLAPGPRPLAPALDTLRSCLNLPSRAAW